MKKTFDDSRERKLERECVCECVFVFQKNEKGKEEKEEKGKERIEGVSSFSRVLIPLVRSLNRYMTMLNFDLFISLRVLHFEYKFYLMAFH